MFIEYKNVNIYQGGKRVLGNVDFHVDEGEFVYIIGHVGSGKSSLLKTLYCELDIDEGDKAVVLERNLLKMKRKEVPALRKELGIIFQDFQLLHDRSVYANLRFVLRATGWKNRKDIDERIDEVLDAADAEKGRQEENHREEADTLPRAREEGADRRAPQHLIGHVADGVHRHHKGHRALKFKRQHADSHYLGIVHFKKAHHLRGENKAQKA